MALGIDELADQGLDGGAGRGTARIGGNRTAEKVLVLSESLVVDLDVLLPAAILHDISREESNHAFTGSIKAKKILKK